MFNAPAQAEIDLALFGAVAGQPSEYERLVAVLALLLQDADPPAGHVAEDQPISTS